MSIIHRDDGRICFTDCGQKQCPCKNRKFQEFKIIGMKEQLKELIETLEERIENVQDRLDGDQEDFHSGYQEGFSYGMEYVVEKLKELLSDE